MIPGVTPTGVYAVGQLPAPYDLSEPDSLTTLLTDPFGGRIYLLEGAPMDPALGALATVRLANQDYSTLPTETPASAFFDGRLINPYNVSVSVFEGGRLATHSIPTYGEAKAANPDGALDRLASYSWAERLVTIKVGRPGFLYEEFGLIFTGTAEDLTWDWNTISLQLRDRQYLLAKPIQTTLYAGTGGLEGGDELKGKPKPLAYGQLREAEPVSVDPAELIYQYHDGQIQSISNLKDAGVVLTNAGDVADLYATTVSAGQYKTDLAKGLLKTGSIPDGILTGDVQGDKTGGVYVSSVPDIIQRILTTRAGLLSADLDLASFATAEASNSSVNNYYTGLDSVDIETVVDDLAGSIGAFWTYSREGLFRLVILEETATPVAVLSQDLEIVQDEMTRPVAVPPSKRIRLGYKRFWTTQEGDALATSVSAEDRAQYKEQFRYVVAENPAVPAIATIYLDAEETQFTSLMDVEADAQAEADRRMVLYGQRRETLSVPLVEGLYSYRLGDTIELGPDFDRYDLWGWTGVVVGLVEDVGDGTAPANIVLNLWGNRVGAWQTPDAGYWLTPDGGRWLTV